MTGLPSVVSSVIVDYPLMCDWAVVLGHNNLSVEEPSSQGLFQCTELGHVRPEEDQICRVHGCRGGGW